MLQPLIPFQADQLPPEHLQALKVPKYSRCFLENSLVFFTDAPAQSQEGFQLVRWDFENPGRTMHEGLAPPSSACQLSSSLLSTCNSVGFCLALSMISRKQCSTWPSSRAMIQTARIVLFALQKFDIPARNGASVFLFYNASVLDGRNVGLSRFPRFLLLYSLLSTYTPQPKSCHYPGASLTLLSWKSCRAYAKALEHTPFETAQEFQGWAWIRLDICLSQLRQACLGDEPHKQTGHGWMHLSIYLVLTRHGDCKVLAAWLRFGLLSSCCGSCGSSCCCMLLHLL